MCKPALRDASEVDPPAASESPRGNSPIADQRPADVEMARVLGTTSRLLLSAADVLEGNAALDTLLRQQLTDILATRLLAAHAG